MCTEEWSDTMFVHTVKVGETLESIAKLYRITVQDIINENAFLLVNEKVYGGEDLNIPEFSDVVNKILDDSEKAAQNKLEQNKNKMPSNQIIPDSTVTLDWGGFTFKTGQIGVLVIVRNTNAFKRVGANKYQKDKSLKKNGAFRCYGETSENGGMFSAGGELYVRKSDAYFMPLPEDKLKELNKSPSTGTVIDRDKVDISGIDIGKAVEAKPEFKSTRPQDLPQLMMPGYRRSRLQVKKADGGIVNIEMRVLSCVRGRSNEYVPTRTNSGWTVHASGSNLTVLNVTCYFLDTLTNRESKDFDKLYKQHLTPKNDGAHFRSELVSFVHKNVEYKGFITNDSLADSSERPLSQDFSFSFLVLSENDLTSTSQAQTRFTIDRKKQGEIEFLSELSNVLKNPVTGK